MDTGYIREFVMLAECLNYSEAAERLFISQSSLSKHIQTLERDLGAALFVRTTRSIRLSGAGAVYLPYAKKLAALCGEAEIAVDDFRRRASTSLTIAIMQNPQYYDMAKYIMSFRRAHPDVAFSMVEGDEFQLYDLFQRKLVNVFPTFSTFRGLEDFAFMPLAESAMVALLPAGHPLAEAGSVSLQQLAGERLLLPARNGALSALVHTAFHREGLEPDVIYEGSSTGCIDLVRGGMGTALHAREFAAALTGGGDIVTVPLEPALPFSYGLGHRDVNDLSPAEQVYLAHMRQFSPQQHD